MTFGANGGGLRAQASVHSFRHVIHPKSFENIQILYARKKVTRVSLFLLITYHPASDIISQKAVAFNRRCHIEGVVKIVSGSELTRLVLK